MENYDIIHQFLQSFAPEIGGRSTDVVTPELEQSLKRFAAGELNDDDLGTLSRELLANEAAMERLAGFLKG